MFGKKKVLRDLFKFPSDSGVSCYIKQCLCLLLRVTCTIWTTSEYRMNTVSIVSCSKILIIYHILIRILQHITYPHPSNTDPVTSREVDHVIVSRRWFSWMTYGQVFRSSTLGSSEHRLLADSLRLRTKACKQTTPTKCLNTDALN